MTSTKTRLLIVLLLNIHFFCSGQDLDITFPSNRSVFQRNNENATIVFIAGNYRTKLDKIEAKVTPINGGQEINWTTIVDQPNFGTYRGSLLVYGGWYKLEVRGIYQGQIVSLSALERFGVGEVFLISGQSNAQGYFGKGQRGAYDDRVNTVSNFISEGHNKPPYPTFGHLDAESAIAPTGQGAWYWGELGDLLTQRLNVPILFLNAAWEGFGVSQFAISSDGARGTNPYSYNQAPAGYPFGSILDALHYYTNLTGLRAILWHQGESDNFLNTSFEDYVRDFQKVIQDSKNKTGKNISWVVAKVSKDRNRFYQPIIDAQNFVINNNGNVFSGPDTDLILDRTDGVHFSTQGFTKVAQAWSSSLTSHFFQVSSPQLGNPPLQIQSFCGLENKNKPMLLLAPEGYVEYQWNTQENSRTLEVGVGSFQGFAKDIYGNVYYSAPIVFDQSMLPQKPTITALGSTEFCAGQSVELQTNAEDNNYWNNGGEGNKIRVSESGNYTVTHINLYSCNHTSDPFHIQNLPTPQPQIIASGSLDFCSDQPTTLTSSLDEGILWSNGSREKELKPEVSGDYFLSAKNEFGCEGYSNTVYVNIRPAALRPNITNLGDFVFCEKDSTILEATHLQRMRWNMGDTTAYLTVKKTGEYFAINTNEHGCQAESQRFEITVNPAPDQPSILLFGEKEVCDNETVKLRSSPAYAYHWNTGHISEEIEVKVSKEIFLTTSNEFDCYSEPSEPIDVLVLETPKNPTIIQTGTFTLSSIFSSDTTNLTSVWLTDTDSIETNIGFIKGKKSGQYTLYGKKYFKLESGKEKYCISNLSVPYNYFIDDRFNGFSVYPNPATEGYLLIETLEDISNANVTIYNLRGQKYLSDFVEIFDRPKRFNVRSVPFGKYILRIQNSRKKFDYQIVINSQ